LAVVVPPALPVVAGVPAAEPPLVLVLTGLEAAAGVVAASLWVAGVPAVPVDAAAVLRLLCVVTGATVEPAVPGGRAELTPVAAGTDAAAVVVRARLAVVRGALATAAVPAAAVVVAVVVPTVVPGCGGAAAAGVRERCGCVGFSCLTIQTVRRTTCVRTSTGSAAGAGLATGRSAKVVNAPSATRVIAPAIVVAGVFRIRVLSCQRGHAHCGRRAAMGPQSQCKDLAKPVGVTATAGSARHVARISLRNAHRARA
jgi:hypothetical protein